MIIIDKIIIIINNKSFHMYNNPAAARIALFNTRSGIPPSNIPIGQIYLQKYGRLNPNWSRINTTANMQTPNKKKYFANLKILSI